MIIIKLNILRISLVVGVILVVSFALINRGDMAFLSVFGVFIVMFIGVLMERERKKQQN